MKENKISGVVNVYIRELTQSNCIFEIRWKC